MPKIYLALYKGRKSGRTPSAIAARAMDSIIRTVSASKYSHCEIAVKEHEYANFATCYSASWRDNGLRRKPIALTADKWDLVEISEINIERLDAIWFENEGKPYDTVGALAAALTLASPGTDKWFCSEFCAAVMGLPHPETWMPGDLADFLGCNPE